MKCKEVKNLLLNMENPADLNGEAAAHMENCAVCRNYFNQIIEMKRSLGQREEYSSMQIDFSLNNLKLEDSLKDKNSKYVSWMNTGRHKLAAGLLVMLLLLSIPAYKTISAMELLSLWKDRISITNNNQEIGLEVGNHSVDLEREYPEAYQLITERNHLINEVLSKKDEKEAYAEIDAIIEGYDERLEELDYQRLQPKPTTYKHFKSMEELQKEITLDKVINPTLPELFQLEKITYSEYGADYKRLDLKYEDYNDEHRINHQKRSLGITYVSSTENQEKHSYSFQKGSKLKEISIGEYDGYILEKGNEQYSSLCVGVFMRDGQLTVYSTSKPGDVGQTENMLMEIAKAIANE